MISHVIRYNATNAPFKQAAFPQYKYPNTKWRYAQIADYLNLGGENEEEKVGLLIQAVENLKRQVDIPSSIKEVVKESEAEFFAKLDDLADQAFDDQCTGANPRYPLISDLKQMLSNAYYGYLEIKETTTLNGHQTENKIEETTSV
jgi:acetaldehyde dehydrogenase/alcohol dehydrogenase